MSSFFFILPAFKNFSGHEGSFVKIFYNICKKKKYIFNLVIPKNNKEKIMQNKFKIIPNSHNNYFNDKIINIFKFYLELKKRIPLKKKNNFLIDGLSFFYIFSLLLFFITGKKQNIFFLYVRDYFAKFNIKNLILITFLRLIKNRFKRIVLLTDTIYIFKKLKLKKIETYILPIPHIIKKENKKKKLRYPLIFLPGPYRRDKGKENLLLFIKNNIKSSFNILVNENFFLRKKFKQLIEFKDSLNKEKYINYLNQCSFVILPYVSDNYRFRTSGIFIESISIVKPVFVSSNTWMAEQLIKFGLKKLVINDWGLLKIDKLINIINQKDTKFRLKKMKNSLTQHHNEKNYIDTFCKILEGK
jgi:hypothetical protein